MYNVDTIDSIKSINSVLVKARSWNIVHIEVYACCGNLNTKWCVLSRVLKVVEINRFHLEYNVIGSEEKCYTIDMAIKTCTCEQFYKDKYLCVYVVVAAKFISGGK